MKCTFGPLITEASGRLGGIIFAKTAGAPYIRTYRKPINSPVLSQNFHRMLIREVAKSYSLCTENEKSQWAAKAATVPLIDKLGNTYYMSGFQCYMRNNMHRAFGDDIPSTLCPNPAEPDPITPVITGVDCVDDTINSHMNVVFPTPIGDYECMFIYASNIISKGIAKCFNYKLVKKAFSDFVTDDNILDDYLAIYGHQPVVGDILHFKFFIYNFEYGNPSGILIKKATVYGP